MDWQMDGQADRRMNVDGKKRSDRWMKIDNKNGGQKTLFLIRQIVLKFQIFWLFGLMKVQDFKNCS